MTYGIIFYEIIHNKVYIYLKRNLNEEYQDISINEPTDDNILHNIGSLYYVKNSDYKHTIYLLDIIKYSDLFDKYKHNLEKINYEIFNQKIFHNNIKHKRIKNFIIKKELDYIILNYKLIKKIKSTNCTL
jgi:hypothetical protein